LNSLHKQKAAYSPLEFWGKLLARLYLSAAIQNACLLLRIHVMLCEGLFKLSVCLLSKWVFKDDFHIPTACLLSFSNLIALRIAHFSLTHLGLQTKRLRESEELYFIESDKMLKNRLRVYHISDFCYVKQKIHGEGVLQNIGRKIGVTA